MELLIGQTWASKDKRRPKEGVVTDFTSATVTLVFDDKSETEYKRDRFMRGWAYVEPAELPIKHSTREEWLQAAITLIDAEVFAPIFVEVPQARVSVGWPGGRGPKKNTIGQCFATEAAGDKIAQVFISPVLEDPKLVLATLVHELVHAVDDCKSGHKKGFIEIAKKTGLTGKWTATVAGDELAETLKGIAQTLGGYPHSALRTVERPNVQKTYMLKIVSVNEPDYFVRMTKGKFEEFGAPRDPWGDEMELEES